MFSFTCMRPLVSKLNALVTKNSPSKIGRGIWLACLLTVSLFGATFAQPDIRYTKGNVDSALRGNFEVDPSTFGMSVNVPLAEYPGRGNALSVNLRYSSKLWRIDFLDTFKFGTLERTRNEGKWGEDNVAGWTSSLALPKVEAAFEYRGPYDGAGQQTCFICTTPPPPGTAEVYINRLLLTMPDGSAHELRKDDSITYSQTPEAGIYYAVDSSNIRYDSANALIYLPDGSRYLLSVNNGTQAQFIDRHGNTMTYTFGTKQWTDTLGRQIGFNLSNQSVGDVINTLPGVGGSTLNYTLRWRSLHDSLSSGSVAVIGSYDYIESNNPQPHSGASLFSTYDVASVKLG